LPANSGEKLARFVQEELDAYAQYHHDFPPPSTRPHGVLVITDRSMDLFAPLIHEFTYQAMAHDLLPIKEGAKVLYKTILHEGTAQQEEKEMEIGEGDKIWINNRHRHMKDTIEKLMGDFQKFLDENPHFTNANGDAASLNAIKDMLAGLPQFQQSKEAYSLHLSMAQECMNIFQHQKLPEIASVEQTLATGLDEQFNKPKNIADDFVGLLDDEHVSASDRLRLIIQYILFRDGLIGEDIERLLLHSALPPNDSAVIANMDLLGARTIKALKDPRLPPQPVFPRKNLPAVINEEYALSRFEPNVKLMLQELVKGTLDRITFPYTKAPLDNSDELAAQAQTSLRSAKPTWARSRTAGTENRQRIIVFMAGGATYSESKACYDVSSTSGRDIFLATSHMITPSLFLRQVGDLSQDRRRLDLPVDRPKPKAPAHLFEREEPKPLGVGMGGPGQRPAGLPGQPGGLPRSPAAPLPPQKPAVQYDARLAPPTNGLASVSLNDGDSKKLEKKSKKSKEESGEKEKKKRHHFFSKK
jgi:syntaxin-binding protein 1